MIGKKGFKISKMGVSPEYPDKNFVPFACYFDKTTLLTKNGELVKILKIPCYLFNKSNKDLFDLREKLRMAVFSSVDQTNVSFWFHTIRRRGNISSKINERKCDNFFSKELNTEHHKENEWNSQFLNELYISIVISDTEDNILKPLNFLSSISFLNFKNIKYKRLKKLHKKLKAISLKIQKSLSDYGVKVLDMKEKKDGYYSEHMKFFSNLINLEKDYFPVSLNDISSDLTTKKIAYGNNVIEITNHERKKFATLFSLKLQHEMSLGQLDQLLQIPQEFVITQMIGYCDKKYFINSYNEQKNVINLSEDIDFTHISGLNDIYSLVKNRPTDYALTQTTIMLISDTRTELNDNVKRIHEVFNKLGLIAVREDVFMPTLFWSQLPGNFSFVKRFSFIPSFNMGSFASLYNFPIGKMRGNHWGNAITIFRTALKTPYFFNFHFENNGTTFIVGPKKSGKTTMLNFLISESRNVCQKLFYVDCKRQSEVFINAINGKYYNITNKKGKRVRNFNLNPMTLLSDEEHKSFLTEWLTNLVSYKDSDKELAKQVQKEVQYIPSILDKIYKSGDVKALSDIVKHFNTENTLGLYKKLLIWCDDGKFSFLFDNEEESDFNDNNVTAFNLSHIIKNKTVASLTAYYILYKIGALASGDPIILAIDNAWKIFDNSFLGPKFKDLIIELAKKNIAVVITTEGSENLDDSHVKDPIDEFFATEIFLPNRKATDYQRKIFNIRDEEDRMLGLMKLEDRNFLLRALNNIIIASNNLDFVGARLLILSNTKVSINAMLKAKELAKSEDSETWLPVFYKIMKQYKKHKIEKMQQERREKQRKWEEKYSAKNTRMKITEQK